MIPFIRLDAVAAPLPISNIDTDKILPAKFLKTIDRKGLGSALFHAMRYEPDGQPRDSFILNRDPWSGAEILIAGDNFGCGSSREHAPWALLDFGIRCVIAPRFADIFHSNCYKNGILPITLAEELVARLLSDAADPLRARMTVDLETQTLETADGTSIAFSIDAQRKHALLKGLDEVALTLGHAQTIGRFEERAILETPWLAPDMRLASLVSTPPSSPASQVPPRGGAGADDG